MTGEFNQSFIYGGDFFRIPGFEKNIVIFGLFSANDILKQF